MGGDGEAALPAEMGPAAAPAKEEKKELPKVEAPKAAKEEKKTEEKKAPAGDGEKKEEKKEAPAAPPLDVNDATKAEMANSGTLVKEGTEQDGSNANCNRITGSNCIIPTKPRSS